MAEDTKKEIDSEEENDLFDDIPDDEAAELDEGEGEEYEDDDFGSEDEDFDDFSEEDDEFMEDEAPAMNPHIQNVVAELREMGIELPDEIDTPDGLVEHLNTALKTHKATKALHGEDEEDDYHVETGDDATVEEPPMMLSTMQKVQRLATYCAQDHVRQKWYRSEIKKRRAWRNSVLDKIERNGTISQKQLSTLREKANVVRLSTVDGSHGGKIEPEQIDLILKGMAMTMQRSPVNDLLQLSTLHAPKSPLKEEQDKETEKYINRFIN